ncbi:MAG: trypsin-like peptidase domain-containing protein, partial [Pseudonocardia sp.]
SPIDRTVTVTTGNSLRGETASAEVVDLQAFSEGDVALVKIPATDLPSVELAPDADVQPGIPVVSIGYPATGKRSSTRRWSLRSRTARSAAGRRTVRCPSTRWARPCRRA